MPLSDFQKSLEHDMKKSVKLVINNNRSTMLSVRWDPDCTKVSLHQFFLDAPQEVMQSLAGYIKQEKDKIPPKVKIFMEEGMRKFDYSHLVDRKKLTVQGDFYNLKTLYDEVNQDYFENKVQLNITWYGKKMSKPRSQLTFGLFHEPLKLIKINRLMDHPDFPRYVISYVIYHEMLHFLFPSYYDKNGRHQVHNKEFKRAEEKFRFFFPAQDWINNNKERLFSQQS